MGWWRYFPRLLIAFALVYKRIAAPHNATRTTLVVLACNLVLVAGHSAALAQQPVPGKPGTEEFVPVPNAQTAYVEFDPTQPMILQAPFPGTSSWVITESPGGANIVTSSSIGPTFALTVDTVGRYDVEVTSGASVADFSIFTDSSQLNGDQDPGEASGDGPLPSWATVGLGLLLFLIATRVLPRRGRHQGVLWCLAVLAYTYAQPAGAVLKVGGVEMTETPANYQSTIKFLTVPPQNQTNPAFNGNDINAIKALEDPIRREIYNKMEGSATETFAFGALAAAQDNWNLRLGAIANMGAMNKGTIDYFYFDPFQKPQIPVSVASAQWSKGTVRSWAFTLNATANPFDGINDLLATKTRGECAGALHACVLGSAASILGKNKFNGNHATLELAKWGDGVAKYLQAAQDRSTVVPGDRAYFSNKDDYRAKAKKTTAFWKGENTIYIGGGLYSGLGLDKQTEAQLRAEMKAHYVTDTGINPFPGNENTDIRFTLIHRLVLP